MRGEEGEEEWGLDCVAGSGCRVRGEEYGVCWERDCRETALLQCGVCVKEKQINVLGIGIGIREGGSKERI